MDKTKKSPIPERTSQAGDKEEFARKEKIKQSPDPAFVRGTFNPPTKKG